MNDRIKIILNQLTLEEKALLCSGDGFWNLKAIERLNIPSIMMSDGPHGLRKQVEDVDHLGLAQSVKNTCFPTAAATACSWDVALIEEIGVALGQVCKKENVEVLLGPGVNIKRHPLCGRNFEYISEDPYLTGSMAAAFVNGVQSQDVGTSLKHFVANNQEYRRMATESVVDERALREIYLAGFEKAIKESQPWTVMCAYNKLDGKYCSDSKRLLTDILRDEWGYDGAVVSDWGACNDRVEGIKAGMDIEMPHCTDMNDKLIIEAVKNGNLAEKELNLVVEEILKLIFKTTNNKEEHNYNQDKHNELARRAAQESIVLLKNDDNILPLGKNTKISVVGEFAKTPRYQGAGSSYVNPDNLQSALDELDNKKIKYQFSSGYKLDTDMVDENIILNAVRHSADAEAVIVFAGLPTDYESEGFDRNHMKMPDNHNVLIDALAQVNENIIVVLQNGAPVEMPWLNKVKAIVECYLGGQAGGPAVVDILFGNVNPSGKLAETFPKNLSNNLINIYFGMGPKTVEYRESIFVGYRYYDSASKDVLFPFGYGLSYTEYEYSDIKLSLNIIKDDDRLTVTFSIKNVGKTAGAEIVQLYIRDEESEMFRPEKELKAFAKVMLEVGQEKIVEFSLDKRAFAYYNTNISNWHVESGYFDVLIGSSSRDIRLSKKVYVESTQPDVGAPCSRETTPEYYDISNRFMITDESFEEVLGKKIPSNSFEQDEEYTINSTLGDVSNTWAGKRLLNKVIEQYRSTMTGLSEEKDNIALIEAVAKEMPIRSMILMGTGILTYKKAQAFIMFVNKRPIKALMHLLFGK